MEKNDWIGLGTSLALHILLLLGFSFLNLGATEQENIGYIEVEFGAFSDGRPVVNARETPAERATQAPQPEPIPEPEPEPVSPPEEARPVDLPDQVVDDADRVTSNDTETISPEEQNNDETDSDDDQSRPVTPLGGGATTGSDGETTGDDGEGDDDTRAAPFQIEGLNRVPVTTPLPRYAEAVNATIRVRITVDPSGRVTQRFPLTKGSPALERAVMDALRTWRFNPLPPNAPREPQTGIITFVFKLQ